MNKENRKRIVKEYLSQSDINLEERKIINDLYFVCSSLDNYVRNIKNDKNIILSNLEDEVYNIDNSILTDEEKIKLEVLYYQELNIHDLAILNELNFIKAYLNNKEVLSSKDIELLKEKLVELQVLTNNDVTFYNSAYKVLDKHLNKVKKYIRG